MNTSAIVLAILTLLSGIGIFLVACKIMSSSLEAASSESLKKLFAKASKSKLLGVGIGAASTAVIQSSGATTVMTIGFVNAGIISLYQAATLIYGANIGTTITAQIVALGMFGSGAISMTAIFSALTGIGALMMMFAKTEKWKTIGGIITGFGMLFVGLSLMSGSMESFAALDSVKIFLAKIKNPLLLIITGAILTAIIQSSSVMTSIALAMVVSGLVSLDQGIYLTMGSNIGSCVVAVLAGATSGTNARRTALIHLLFNCFGVVVFLLVGWLISLLTSADGFGRMFASLFPGAPQTQLAMFHTFFNVTTVALMLPLTKPLVTAVTRIIPGGKDATSQDTAMHLRFLDENMLKTPPVAVQQLKREILRMASVAMENVRRALSIVTTLDFSDKETFKKREEELDFLNDSLVKYVVRLSTKSGLSNSDSMYLSTTYRTIRDLERIGDYAENFVEYAEALHDIGQSFSPAALEEIKGLESILEELYYNTIVAYKDLNLEALEAAAEIEERTDDFTRQMEDNHIKRLTEGVCTPEVGAQYLSLSSNAERIADHLFNVAKSIKNLPQSPKRR